MIQKMWQLKLIRFALVGVFNTLLDFLMLNVLVFGANLPVLLANTISVCVGISMSYVLNHHIVFQSQGRITLAMYLRFFLITGISILVIQTIVIHITVTMFEQLVSSLGEKFGFTGIFSISFQDKLVLNLSKATAVLAGMVWNYLMYAKIIFKQSAKDDVQIE